MINCVLSSPRHLEGPRWTKKICPFGGGGTMFLEITSAWTVVNSRTVLVVSCSFGSKNTLARVKSLDNIQCSTTETYTSLVHSTSSKPPRYWSQSFACFPNESSSEHLTFSLQYHPFLSWNACKQEIDKLSFQPCWGHPQSYGKGNVLEDWPWKMEVIWNSWVYEYV